jgi:hypothetical protein
VALFILQEGEDIGVMVIMEGGHHLAGHLEVAEVGVDLVVEVLEVEGQEEDGRIEIIFLKIQDISITFATQNLL